MTYKEKPIFRPVLEAHNEIIDKTHEILLDASETAANEMDMSGVAFVAGSLVIWMLELIEIDPKATSKLFEALSVMSDPSSSHTQKVAAEKRRLKACEQLYRSTDLQMATEGATKQ